MIKTSKKIDKIVKEMEDKNIDVSVFSDICISADGDDPSYLVEKSFELGRKIGHEYDEEYQFLYKISSKYGFYYFDGDEKDILQKLKSKQSNK